MKDRRAKNGSPRRSSNGRTVKNKINHIVQLMTAGAERKTF